MKNVLVISNQTAFRASIIKSRTGSDFVAGAKAMMIEQLKQKLREGIVSLAFMKKDGTLRVVECATTNSTIVEKWTNGNGMPREYVGCVAFLELTATGIQWRSFRMENLIAIF